MDPTPNTPQRPATVPAHAEWLEAEAVWRVGATDAAGRRHGEEILYRQSGAVVCIQTCEAGKPHGQFRRFHPNGDLAREGRYWHGALDGEVRALGSDEPTTEHLRTCCVPPGAWALRATYERGRCVDERFYNREHQWLMDDGSVHPERPSTVPAEAHFLGAERRWAHGHFEATGREGQWRWWAESGALVEDAHYREGNLHGQHVVLQAGRVVAETQYQAGVPHGRCVRAASGAYQDLRIVREEGELQHGLRAGLWRVLDSEGQVLAQTHHGQPPPTVDSAHPAFTHHASGELARTRDEDADQALAALAERLDEEGQCALALIVRMRAAVLTGDGSAAARVVQSCTQPRSAAASGEWLAAIRNPRGSTAPVEDGVRRGLLLDALLAGVTPWRVVRELATLSLDAPAGGLELVRITDTLWPQPELRALRTALMLELGYAEAARAEAELFAELAEDAGRRLIASVTATYPRPRFWPAETQLGTEVSPELPQAVEQSVSVIHTTAAKYARRLSTLCEQIRAQSVGNVEPWLPPDVSAIFGAHAVELQRYEFVAGEGDTEDRVVVDERLDLSGQRLSSLMSLARRNWLGLCWLCWATGLDEVAQPLAIRPRTDFGRALTTAFQRHWRAKDQLQTRGLRARSRNVPGFHWEGLPLQELPPHLTKLAVADYEEMRAVLYFLADATCRSPWQDDLRT